jgi:hypothetical protein
MFSINLFSSVTKIESIQSAKYFLKMNFNSLQLSFRKVQKGLVVLIAIVTNYLTFQIKN